MFIQLDDIKGDYFVCFKGFGILLDVVYEYVLAVLEYLDVFGCGVVFLQDWQYLDERFEFGWDEWVVLNIIGIGQFLYCCWVIL